MISNQILQSTIDGIKGITRVDLTVADIDGKIMATTQLSQPNLTGAILDFANSPADSQEIQNSQFFKIYDEQQPEYILISAGAG